MSRLVIVSNRVAHPDHDTPAGGLAVGVLGALKRPGGGLWFGWSGEKTPGGGSKPSISRKEDIEFATIDLPSEHFDGYYNGFCNGSLWPLHHYFTNTFRYDGSEYEDYLAINRFYCDALMPLLRSDDVVWIHDYQLVPLGRMLRERGAGNRIGFFLHIPFPGIAVYRLLPPYRQMTEDLCQYDLLGFQTEEDHEAFLTVLESVRGLEHARRAKTVLLDGHKLRLGAFPIGVDVDGIQREAKRARDEDPQVSRLIASLLGRQLLLGVDRLDYSKGLVERFNSFEYLLETSPELHGNITFVQIAPLSRTDVAAYAQIRDALERTSGHINGRFADADWTPIRYLNRDFSHETLSAFLRIADVAVVTPLRDGMNLVAKEFVAAQDPERPGVLVLSSIAGAAAELADGALLVNPYDKAGVGNAVKRALSMPVDERIRRHQAMLASIRGNSISNWHEQFLAALQDATP